MCDYTESISPGVAGPEKVMCRISVWTSSKRSLASYLRAKLVRLGCKRLRVEILHDEPGQMLARIARQALPVGKQHAARSLGQGKVTIPAEYGGDKALPGGFVGWIGEGTLGGAIQNFWMYSIVSRLDTFISITMP